MTKLEPYSFQNIYLITTYRCNWDCDFCLFKYNIEEEAPINEIIHRLEYSIKDSQRKVYIKITGGEPFLTADLLRAIFDLSKKYQNKIYKIGIGTNGSIRLPYFFNDVTIKTHIFLSRHNWDEQLPTPKDLLGNIDNELIDFRVNCNLIKGGIDNIDKIKRYIKNSLAMEVDHICFRELSKVEVDFNAIYPEQIYDYISYYKEHVIYIKDIEHEIKSDPEFSHITRKTGNYYDLNNWYWFTSANRKVSVKFRSIDEVKLIEYNKNINPDEVDEYVIHPDGTLTGCWDKESKIIMKGGSYHA